MLLSRRKVIFASATTAWQKRFVGSTWDMADPSRFSKLGFWEDYHHESNKTKRHHEWFVEGEQATEVLLPWLKDACTNTQKAPSILHLGCGTSALGIELAQHPVAVQHGIQITNLDFSKVAIDAMREAYKEADLAQHRNRWVLGDALSMPFPDNSFDLVVDKGTLDAFEFADVGARQRSDSSGSSSVVALCGEVDRVLKRSAAAAWLQITHDEPELRVESLLRSLPAERASSPSGHAGVHALWTVGHQSLGEDENGFEYFLYVVQRQPQSLVCDPGSAGEEKVISRFVSEDDAAFAAKEGQGHVKALRSRI